MIHWEETGLKHLTFDSQFNSFSMCSRDGKKRVFASHRNNGGTQKTRFFIADWVE